MLNTPTMKQLLAIVFVALGLNCMSQVPQWGVLIGHADADSICYISQVFVRPFQTTDAATKGHFRLMHKEMKDIRDSQIDLLYFDTKQHAARGRAKLERECGLGKRKVVMLEEIPTKEGEPAPSVE